MSAVPAFEPDLFMSEPAYLAFEDASTTKHEFVDGHVYDWPGYDYDEQGMVGARLRHNILQVNIVTSLAAAARAAGCQVVGSDLRLRIRQLSTRRYYYPDAMVLCDPQDLDNDEATHVSRPCVVFEILSDRSMRIDHIEKLQIYRAIPEVQTYIIINQHERRVERHWRDADDTWHFELVVDEGRVSVPCVGVHLSLDSIYRPSG